jgi:S-(hydroxymethyl)glutathione dehydrogenase / alcohol dehydrogenase
MLTFRAAVLRNLRQPVSIQDAWLEDLRGDDVLVRIEASGVCHTDLEVIDGSAGAALPTVLGHEGAGIVEGLGPDATNLKRGDRVVLSWNPNCGQCYYCVRDQPILCQVAGRAAGAGTLLDGSRRLMDKDGPLNHFGFVSSHADMAVVPQRGAIVVSADIPSDRACLIGCGVMTGVGAAQRIARVDAGSTVAVFGCGVVGLSVVAGARIAGARRIIAVDLQAERLATAAHLGATHLVRPPNEDAIAEIKRLTGGRGSDYVFEAVGNAGVFRDAVEAARPGGKVVFLGKVDPKLDVSFRWGSLMEERVITRSSYGGARPARDFPYLAALYLEGQLDLDSLITSRHSLSEIDQALDVTRSRAGIRAVITH